MQKRSKRFTEEKGDMMSQEMSQVKKRQDITEKYRSQRQDQKLVLVSFASANDGMISSALKLIDGKAANRENIHF